MVLAVLNCFRAIQSPPDAECWKVKSLPTFTTLLWRHSMSTGLAAASWSTIRSLPTFSWAVVPAAPFSTHQNGPPSMYQAARQAAQNHRETDGKTRKLGMIMTR